MEDYVDFLTTNVLQDNKPITYKALARSLKIHVDTAKQALYTFATANSSRVHIVYCITGQLITTKQFTIQLVKSSKLEETKKLFKPLSSVHVYSVTSYDPVDFSVLYAACKDTPRLSLEERYKCGAVKNPNATYKTLEKSRAMQSKPTLAAAAAAPKVPASTSSKPAPAFNMPPKHKKGTLSFTPTTKKPITKETPVEKKPAAAKPAVAKGVKRKTDHDEAIEDKLAKATIKVQDIFSDDEDDVEEEESKHLPEEEDVMEIDDIVDDKQESVMEIEDDTPSSPEKSAPLSSAKPKRKVLKKKTTMNARGHMVTEEVWEWEEVDEEEAPSPKPTRATNTNTTKPAPAPAKSTTKKATGKKPTAQTNLFSFFNKK